MNLITDSIKKVYFRYLASAFGSTLIISIYSLVDTIVIGKYEGPNGTAAAANVMPMWSVLFAFGFLYGIGGSVLMAQRRGAGKCREGNEFFTVAMLLGIGISALLFFFYNGFSEQLLYLSGGRGEVLSLAKQYCFWISVSSPLFVIGQVLIPFIRNDGHPGLTTLAVMSGGIFNIFGDVFFVFGLDMGIGGAGLATALGQLFSTLIFAFYLLSPKCTLHFEGAVLRNCFWSKARQIVAVGISTFIVDLAIGVLAVFLNNQIMRYSGAAALAAYGVISTLATTAQSFGYAIGESGQAIMAVNYGAGRMERVLQARKLMSVTALYLGGICLLAGMCFPKGLISLFMTPTWEVFEVGTVAIRIYFTAFVFLVFNVSATYYFQAVGSPRTSFLISIARGVALSGIFIWLLPMILGIKGLWLAIPVTELIVSIYVVVKYKSIGGFADV